MLRDLVYRLRAMLRRHTVERELNDELQFHLDRQTAKHERAGLAKDDARRRARGELGLEQVKEACRDAWATRAFHETIRDVRYALRLCRRHKVGVATAVVALALGLGVTTAVVGMVDVLLFKPPAGVREPDRVLSLGFARQAEGETDAFYPMAWSQFEEVRIAQTAFSSIGGFVKSEMPISTAAHGADRVTVEVVTGEYFRLLGVLPPLGRGLDTHDDEPGAPPVVVLSHGYWQRAFNADPGVIGTTFLVRGHPVTVIGVAPRAFAGLQYEFLPDPAFWLTLRAHAAITGSQRLTGRFPFLYAIGRLADDVSLEEARAQMAVIMQSVTVLPTDPFAFDALNVTPVHRIGQPRVEARFSQLFRVLLVVSGLVLLAAVFNVTNLLLAQGTARTREIAIRLAMGATRGAVVRLLLVEALLIGGMAGALASVATFVFGRAFTNLGRLSSLQNVSVRLEPDVRLVAVGIGLTLITTLVFGAVTAFWISRRGTRAGLTFTGTVTHGRAFLPFARQGFILAQAAFALLLGGTALLYMDSLRKLQDVPLGFNPDHILLARVDPYALTPDEGSRFYDALMPALTELPGVIAVGSHYWQPLSGVAGNVELQIPGDRPDFRNVPRSSVGDGFFKAYDVPFVAGRDFSTDDDFRAGIIVNDLLAEQLWPGQAAPGRILTTQNTGGSDRVERTVLGVVKFDRCIHLAAAPGPCAFTPVTYTNGGTRLAIRTEGSPQFSLDQIRATITALDRRIVVEEVRTFADFLRDHMVRERTSVQLMSVLAVLGLVLVGTGCAALFASLVAERRSELALRMALGATAGQLVRGVLRRSLLLGATGVIGGSVAAALLHSALQERLFETGPIDWRLLAVAGLGVLLVAVAATCIPARRVLRIDPAEVLKEESFG